VTTVLKPRLSRRNRGRPVDADHDLRLRVAQGDVAEVLPADLLLTRSLDDDKAELTRIVEQFAANGSIDRATGGHLLDDTIDGWHHDQVSAIKRTFLTREATAGFLIGEAESLHQDAREKLGSAAERCQRHEAAAQRARTELIGPLEPAHPSHADLLRDAAARNLPHDDDCLNLKDWTPPWQESPSPDHLRDLQL